MTDSTRPPSPFSKFNLTDFILRLNKIEAELDQEPRSSSSGAPSYATLSSMFAEVQKLVAQTRYPRPDDHSESAHDMQSKWIATRICTSLLEYEFTNNIKMCPVVTLKGIAAALADHFVATVFADEDIFKVKDFADLYKHSKGLVSILMTEVERSWMEKGEEIIAERAERKERQR